MMKKNPAPAGFSVCGGRILRLLIHVFDLL